MSYNERQVLLEKSSSPIPVSRHARHYHRSSSSEEWSDDNSSSYYSNSSSYSQSDSSNTLIPDWEPFIDENKALFYIQLDPMFLENQHPSSNSVNNTNDTQTELSRVSTRRSKKTSNKFTKILNRSGNNKKPKHKLTEKLFERTSNEVSKVTFSETTHGELKKIKLFVDPLNRYKYGRRASLSEAILGISVSAFPDGHRIMVASFMPDSSIATQKQVKVGDWLKLIDDNEVNVQNIDTILLSIESTREVIITFQRIADEESIQPTQTASIKITNLTTFAENLKLLFVPKVFCDPIVNNQEPTNFGLMYLTMNGLTENGPEGEDVLFCYPDKEENSFYTARGSFLTINSIFETTFITSPVLTTILIKEIPYFIIYKKFNEDVLLICFSSTCATVEEAKLKSDEIIRYLELTNKVISDYFLQKNFTDLLAICNILSVGYMCQMHDYKNFEVLLPEPHFIPLPKEAQLRINDALNEMEAMDYREWNDDSLNSQREFFIIGSALYYKQYLLSTHLPNSDMYDVESFLRNLGLANIFHNQNLRELIIWREIFIKSCQRGHEPINEIYGIPDSRWFLVIVGKHEMLLAVILESRQNNLHTAIEPSQFYIEEIQDTLDHMNSIGIESLSRSWILCNKRPECVKQKSLNFTSPVKLSSSLPSKKTEIISILKRRNNSTENIGDFSKHSSSMGSMSGGGGGSIHSQTLSEDSNHKYGDGDDQNDSESDWDGFRGSQRSNSVFNMSDISDCLMQEVAEINACKFTAGKENTLYSFVQLEVGAGILLAPTGLPNDLIIKTFRETCLLIHTVLKNSLKFRHLLSQEESKPSSHRSLVAIKEHGVLITITTPITDEVLEFWVIGRLFIMPERELYICYSADIPQNLVEIAFRIALNTAG